MAATFYIESLTVRGEGKRDSTVTFGPKLNILIGPSDSGKTMILDCIAYVFGKDGKCPITKDVHGYDTMTVSIMSSSGYRTEITRILEGKQATIKSNDPNIISRDYPYEDKDKKTVSDVLFSLIGITSVPRLAYNSVSAKKKMTWRNFIRAVYLDRDKLLNSDDLILPKDGMQKTLFLSILLYILYGKDFSFESMAKKEITQARYQATTDYIIKSEQNMNKRIEELRKKLQSYYGPELPSSIDSYSETLSNIEEQIKDCVEESNNLYKAICEANKNLNERKVARDSYANLDKQYVADIERLSSMAQGGRLLDGAETLHSCPFCHNEISPEFKEINIEGAKAELKKTMQLYNGLVSTERVIDEQIKQIEQEIKELNFKKHSIENQIVSDLKPRATELKKEIALYEEYCELKAQEGLYREIIKNMSEDQASLKATYEKEMEEYKERKYSPLEFFNPDFENEMTSLIQRILLSCGYVDYKLARFDMGSFNISLIGRRKEVLHGQGYSTFLNSSLYLAFSKYMAEKAVYKPSFLMLDTPLLGLKEGQDKTVIHNGFFNDCVLDISNELQLFMAVHPEDVPDSFDRTKCEVREYMTNGHSGFLLDFHSHQSFI